MIDLDQLLRRAAPSGTFLNRETEEQDGSIANRLSRWRNNAARNSGEGFARRLEWEGLTTETARSVLGDERALNAEDHRWASVAGSIFRHLTEDCSSAENKYCRPPSDVPFAPLLLPLVSLAMGELTRATGVPPLTPEVEVQLREPLYSRFAGIINWAVGSEFRSFRDAFPAGGGAWLAFEEHMRRGGWLELFERMPVLLRLLATAISLWVAETAEFLRRLDADRDDLERIFGSGELCGNAVERISGMLSDPHRGGRNVKIVGFASGLRVVYKPRNLAIDAAWFGLTEWMGQRTGLALQSPRVLNRSEWGWAEFIPHEPCNDIEAVERFYRRAGHLLCLMYVTASTDFHDENVVARGEFPVPIDLETVFNPDPFTQGEETAATIQFRDSVRETIMLPNWVEMSGQNDATDISALGSRPETQPETIRRCWIHPNSDDMEFVTIRGRWKHVQNAPFLADGPSPDAGQFVGKLTAGFSEAYDCLMANRDALLAPDGPLEAFRNCRTRLLVRPTQVYDRVAERALSASCLAFGVDRSLEFEGLSRHFLASGESHGSRAMFRAEVRAMEQLDVPYFQLRTDSCDLLDDEGNVVERNFVKTPGYEKARQRIAALSEADRSFQLQLIRASFAARGFGGPDRPPVFGTRSAIPESGHLLDAARGIARDIEGRTIWLGEEAHWIGHESLPVSGRLYVRLLGSSLYSGLAGVALFLAAMFAVDGGPEYRRAAVGAARKLRGSRMLFPAAGSEIYGLLKTGQLLNDEETIDTALSLSRLLDTDGLRADKNLDVLGGAAGVILSLLPLWERTGEAELLEKAVICGERLLEMRTAEGAWLTGARRPMAGYSHGAAGIGLALLRLHAAAPDPRFREAAMAGFAYERTLLSPEACNWEDLRDDVERKDRFVMASWCHGAPGVALSRIGALRLVQGDELESPLCSDLEYGLRYLAGGEIGSNGTVCCGEMGRAETLLEAARYLKRPELEVQARQRASCAVAGLLPVEETPFVPGLFNGSAGIGYGLLRLIAPDRLPSILLWE
jgi:type 2 lantibiotic biosynthesis protein LanM